MVNRKLTSSRRSAGGCAHSATRPRSAPRRMTMKKLLVRAIARPKTAPQPVSRRVARAEPLARGCARSGARGRSRRRAPTAIGICSQWSRSSRCCRRQVVDLRCDIAASKIGGRMAAAVVLVMRSSLSGGLARAALGAAVEEGDQAAFVAARDSASRAAGASAAEARLTPLSRARSARDGHRICARSPGVLPSASATGSSIVFRLMSLVGRRRAPRTRARSRPRCGNAWR